MGIKTIVPAKATAKISCRLVPDQDPDHVMSALKRHVETHAPPQTRLKFLPLPFRAHPYIMPRDTVANRAATKVMATSGILLCAVKASGLPFTKVRSVLTNDVHKTADKTAAWKSLEDGVQVLKEVFGAPTLFYREGWTIPFFDLCASHLGIQPISFGFGLPTDGIHSANER